MADSRILALMQLLRLPNVFTAAADVLLGYLVTNIGWQPWEVVALLVGSSCLVYMSGMVLNDWFDREVDAIERPERPIPSGRVPASAAASLGFGMLALGVAAGWGAAALAHLARPGLVATALAAVVLLYDGVLKRSLLGPLLMGGCRALNVLLGMSASLAPLGEWQFVLAGGIGVYIVGVTWFARTEAVRSKRYLLAAALAVMMGGVAMVASYPKWTTGNEFPPISPSANWNLFWVLIAALVGWRCLRAVADPSPRLVQAAVKNCILSLIVFDAAACTAAVQSMQTVLVILALYVPTVVLGRWIYST